MALDSFEKQASEKFVISASFADDLDVGESIVLNSSSVVAEDVEGNPATSTILNVPTLSLENGSKLKVQVMAGEEEKSPYKITFKAVTDALVPNAWELDIKMKIKEL